MPHTKLDLETPETFFWRIMREYEDMQKQNARKARPTIPHEGVPNPDAVALYATACAKAEAIRDLRIFFLNLRDENFKPLKLKLEP